MAGGEEKETGWSMKRKEGKVRGTGGGKCVDARGRKWDG